MNPVDLGIPGLRSAEEIARGGFGVVYRAYQTAFEREVAVKLISTAGFSDEDKQRFLSECRALGRVSDHPAIVAVYDAGFNQRGEAYVVMQYVSGGSLADRMKAGPLPVDTVTTVGRAIASAIDAAHAVGVLHLDVKPANVLVDRFGNYLLTDFGIARLLDAPRTLTHQTIAGTPGFIAPELLDGRPASRAADIYEIGATLYALAAGTAPYQVKPNEGVWQLLARMGREPPAPLPPSVPPVLSAVIERAMARDPAERFASGAELAAALMGSGTIRRPAAAPVSTPAAPPPAPAAPPPPPAAAPPPPPLVAPTVPGAGPLPAATPARRDRTVLIAGVVAGAIILGATGVIVAATRGGGGSADEQSRTTTVPETVETTVAAATTADPATDPAADPTPAPTTAAGADTTVPAEVSTTAATTSTAAAPTTTGPFVPVFDLNLDTPRDVAVAPDGAIVVLDGRHNRVMRISAGGSVSIVAGTGVAGFSGDGGPATAATLNDPEGVTVGLDGTIYIADKKNHRIRRVGTDGVITTLAGNGNEFYSGDGGPATAASMDDAIHLTVAPDGAVVFADNKTFRIRRVGTDGIIDTIIGTGGEGFSGDGGFGTSTPIKESQAVAFTADGSLVFSETFGHRIRMMRPDGTIVTLAGTGDQGDSGDGGPATAARLNKPVGVAVAPDGSVVFCDWGNHKVRRIATDGTITTIAGSGTAGYSGDGGFGTSARLNQPDGIAVAGDGTVYVADSENHAIRIVTTDGRIYTIAR